MENFLNAKAMISFVLWAITTVNVTFAIEGNSPLPDYMHSVFIADAVDLGIWLIIGIGYAVWTISNRKNRRRLGVLRYDGQRKEWYYQR